MRTLFRKVTTDQAAHDKDPATLAEKEHVDENDDFFDVGGDSDAAAEPDPVLQHRDVDIGISRYIDRPDTRLEMLNDFPIIRKLFLRYNTPLP